MKKRWHKGIALLAAFCVNNSAKLSLPDYLEKVVFGGSTGTEIAPTEEDIAGFDAWIKNYTACIPIEEAAVRHKA